MNSIKVAGGLACSILAVLILLIVFAKNPEKARYDSTVETLMAREGFTSKEQTLNHYPELREINLKMERIAYLNSNIHSLTAGPAPNISSEESQQIQDFNQEIHQLRIHIEQELTQLTTSYAIRQTD